jgi:hypothetical protein
MSGTARLPRPADAIERDFLDVRGAALPFQVCADKIERLWDEINDAAASLLPDEGGMPYLALLRQLQDELDRRKRNVYLAQISGIRWNARW